MTVPPAVAGLDSNFDSPAQAAPGAVPLGSWTLDFQRQISDAERDALHRQQRAHHQSNRGHVAHLSPKVGSAGGGRMRRAKMKGPKRSNKENQGAASDAGSALMRDESVSADEHAPSASSVSLPPFDSSGALAASRFAAAPPAADGEGAAESTAIDVLAPLGGPGLGLGIPEARAASVAVEELPAGSAPLSAGLAAKVMAGADDVSVDLTQAKAPGDADLGAAAALASSPKPRKVWGC